MIRDNFHQVQKSTRIYIPFSQRIGNSTQIAAAEISLWSHTVFGVKTECYEQFLSLNWIDLFGKSWVNNRGQLRCVPDKANTKVLKLTPFLFFHQVGNAMLNSASHLFSERMKGQKDFYSLPPVLKKYWAGSKKSRSWRHFWQLFTASYSHHHTDSPAENEW